MNRKKYAVVGTGARVPMFIDPICSKYSEISELVGLCDASETRRTYHQQRLAKEFGAPLVPTYSDFDLMIKAQKPDVVIVCTPDSLHHEFVVKALEAGAEVISEKPLTIDAPKCRDIFDAVRRTGGKVRTTFNMRWTPGVTKVRELINAGEIGTVKHLDFEYFLNTFHGADYFRRWHSQKHISGGLLLHKSTHHFDVINWWLDGIPSEVFAMGDLVFYGKKNAVARGDERLTRYARYTGAKEAEDDPFRLSLDENITMRDLYLNAEADSGYVRDRNVFRDEIDIEDSMSLLIKYRSGAMVTYSLTAYSPYEGFRVSISGDRGRIELTETHASHIITGDKENHLHGENKMRIRLQKHFSPEVEFDIPPKAGGHGGGDVLIQEQMFSSKPPEDTLFRNAGHEQGAASLLIGAAANISMKTGQLVKIDELISLNPSVVRLSELI